MPHSLSAGANFVVGFGQVLGLASFLQMLRELFPDASIADLTRLCLYFDTAARVPQAIFLAYAYANSYGCLLQNVGQSTSL